MNDHLLQEGLFSAIFNNSKNFAPSSQELRPDAVETTRKRESEMKRESLNTQILSHHFQSWSGMLNHTGGIHSHHGMMLFRNKNLGKFLDSMEFQSWKANFKNEECTRTVDPQITMHWIKEVEIAKVNRRTCNIAIDCGANRFP